MLVTIAQLHTRKQSGAFSCQRRVFLCTIERTVERAVIGNVRRAEAGAGVPLTISLGIESAATVVRCRRVAMEVNCDEIGIGES